MFAKLIVVGALHFVKVILVQLPDEGGKIGVFEHPGQDRFCEFVHVLDDKAVATGTPRNDMLEVGIFEHPGWFCYVSLCLQTGSVGCRRTCRASLRNRRWRTLHPPLDHVSTGRTGSCSTPAALREKADGTPVSRAVGL